MTISKKRIVAKPVPNGAQQSQMTIFEAIAAAQQTPPATPAPAICADLVKELKHALTEDLRNARDEQGRDLSRYQVAARMSEILGDDITKTALDNWTAPSHPHIIPLLQLPAFVQATGGRRAFEVLSRRSGLFALPGPEALRAEIQRLDEEIQRKKGEKMKRKLFLRELENGR